jgi:2-polyprenyl-3-methyl-5-hydroxy-6-metoxy-1,4-benzoquinol methylase
VRYDPSSYAGAAVHYRSGRPPYSPQLEALLAEDLGLDGSGRLLDVGCGPGILTVRLARLFEGVVGLDPDPAMIAEGRQAARERDIAEPWSSSDTGPRGGPFRRARAAAYSAR